MKEEVKLIPAWISRFVKFMHIHKDKNIHEE